VPPAGIATYTSGSPLLIACVIASCRVENVHPLPGGPNCARAATGRTTQLTSRAQTTRWIDAMDTLTSLARGAGTRSHEDEERATRCQSRAGPSAPQSVGDRCVGRGFLASERKPD